MSVLGVESVIYGVDDLAATIRFYEDFGLHLVHQDERGAEFDLPEGSHIVLRAADDPALPARFAEGPGAREIVWGVDNAASLAAIAADLATDRVVTADSDGTLHTRDDIGIPIGFRIFARKAVAGEATVENAPGDVQRWNAHRRWYKRAQPKIIHHTVFSTPDMDAAVAFYTERLGFRISDISRGLGVFLRADGRNDHHNLFFLNAPRLAWHHVSFGVDNIDELMTGADHMQRCGWSSDIGIGRHRISSTIFYYIRNPAGGAAEYSADTDYLTDEWQPRLWNPIFGNFHWVGALPPVLAREPEWDVRILEQPIPKFSAL
jgi:catechol 2,3-dioxygenase-like lactoylglutathione lyase family enzyme